MSLSLIDLSTATVDPDATVLSVRTTCTNRDLPSRLPFGNQDSDFEMEGTAAMKRIVALRKPTQPVRPALGKSALWRLVSHLSLNYLSLVEQGKEALQEILRLYDVGRTAYSQNVIQSILQIRSRPHFTRLVSEQGVSFARGLRIEMELDEDQFIGGGAFLFANVLERFFGLSASLNSFTQLSVTTPQRKEGLHEWQPRSGRKPARLKRFAAGRASSPKSACSFEFFQAVTLLQRLSAGCGPVGGFSNPEEEAVHFRVNPRLGFPASQIQTLELAEDGSAGDDGELHGAHRALGVLPYTYSELILERSRAKDHALADVP